MNINSIDRRLKKTLKEARYTHTLGTVKECIKLGKIYNIDSEKLEIAAYLHDCGKNEDKIIMKSELEKAGYTKEYIECSNIIHAPYSAILARKVYDIEDEEILDAIRYHCTGKANMSLFEKIVYVGDTIEESREFDGVELLRKKAYNNIDDALIAQLDFQYKKIKEYEWYLPEDSKEAFKFYNILL